MPEVAGINLTVYLAVVYVGLGLFVVVRGVKYSLNPRVNQDQELVLNEALKRADEINY